MTKNKLSLLFSLAITTTLFAQTNDSYVRKLIADGVALHDKGRYADALRKFQTVLKTNPIHPSANYEAANSCTALRRYEDALQYADKVIQNPDADLPDAFVLKGNVLDMMGEVPEAIETYQTGLTQYPKNHLLHFNLAVAHWGEKEYQIAENELITAIKIRPNHAGSHLVLGLLNRDRGNRVKSILSLYNFLLLEPEGKRAESAFKTLEALTTHDDNEVQFTQNDKLSISMQSLPDESDDFRSVELAWAVSKAIEKKEAKKDSLESKSIDNQAVAEDVTHLNKPHHYYEGDELARFAVENEKLFQLLSDLKDGKTGFYWEFYVDFFDDLYKKRHTETLSYFVSLTKKENKIMDWLRSNPQKVEALSDWYAGFEWKFQ
jgi:tetratricopeptide (TPR) repeat protein